MQTYHLHIKGIVQGIGFRPFIYRLANRLGLPGFVSNGSDGLHIEVNTDENGVQNFISMINKEAPRHSKITSILLDTVPNVNYLGFNIASSMPNNQTTAFCPDLASCEHCISEMFDPDNRRYQYAFITCTHCGPRYSIIQALPYDRENTSMDKYTMCQSCLDEYNDVNDRRYYSQTNSCPKCGIQLSVKDNQGQALPNDIHTIVKAISDGKIVAVKGMSGYLLICDANHDNAIETLRSRKHRPSKPFAIMVKDLSDADSLVKLTKEMKAELASSVAPIVIADIKNKLDGKICYELVAPRLHTLGVMMPNTGLMHLIMHLIKRPLICTSANISGSAILYTEEEMTSTLSNVYDVLVSHDRAIVVPQDDSVIRFSKDHLYRIIIRRSRGLAPNLWIDYAANGSSHSIAIGGDIKNTIAVASESQFFVSQYLGDQSSYAAQMNFESMTQYVQQIFIPKVENVIMDMHPEYQVNHTARRLWPRGDHYTMQHHHAHLFAILGEHHLISSKESILGFIWDGVGYGNDKAIWGGEVFEFNQGTVHRRYHFDYFPYFMGNKMSEQPRLAALSILNACEASHDFIRNLFDEKEWSFYQKQWSKSDFIMTSSVGRIFDAVAALLDICSMTEYEGQAALLLEESAKYYFDQYGWLNSLQTYPVSVSDDGIIEWKSMMRSIIHDYKNKVNVNEIAAKFHLTLVRIIQLLSAGIHKIAFSGGVFQNAVLVQLISQYLGSTHQLYFHEQLSPNDENISFGQLINYLHFNKQSICA